MSAWYVEFLLGCGIHLQRTYGGSHLVYTIISLEVAFQGIEAYKAWWTLGAVWGNLSHLRGFPSPSIDITLLTEIVTSLVHGFYSWRIAGLMRGYLVVVLTGLVSMAKAVYCPDANVNIRLYTAFPRPTLHGDLPHCSCTHTCAKNTRASPAYRHQQPNSMHGTKGMQWFQRSKKPPESSPYVQNVSCSAFYSLQPRYQLWLAFAAAADVVITVGT